MSIHDEAGCVCANDKWPHASIENTVVELAKIFIGQASTYQLESLLSMYELKQPGQIAMYAGLIAATYRIALLEAENRSLRIVTGNLAVDNSIRFFPEVTAFMDAMNSDLRQAQATGRMPKLMHFEQRVRNAETRSKISDAGRALKNEVTEGHSERI